MEKSLKTQLTRERIISTALKEFADKGYPEFRINEFLKIAGVSKGNFYHHFKGKDELYIVCLRLSFEKAVEILKGKDETVCSFSEYFERRKEFYKNYPYHGEIFLEGLIASYPMIENEIIRERNIIDEFNRLVLEQMIRKNELKVSPEKAFDYLDFIQKLFRNYFFTSMRYNPEINLNETYEAPLQEYLELILSGLFKQK